MCSDAHSITVNMDSFIQANTFFILQTYLLFGFDEGAYLYKSIFHLALNVFMFDCEITLELVPGTNQY